MHSQTHLRFLGPFSNIIVVLARMLGVEVWESFWVLWAVPDLAEDSSVRIAHEDLAESVDAVR